MLDAKHPNSGPARKLRRGAGQNGVNCFFARKTAGALAFNFCAFLYFHLGTEILPWLTSSKKQESVDRSLRLDFCLLFIKKK